MPRRPLKTLPSELVDDLDAAGRRELADLGADLDRAAWARRRMGQPGGAEIPPYLEPVEAEATGAARLYYCLDADLGGEPFTEAQAVSVGHSVGLGHSRTLEALDALRRAELVRALPSSYHQAARFVTVQRGGVPF